MTAIRPGNDNNELYYSWTARHSFMQFHVYMYFAELERLEPNMKREFTVCCGTDSCFDGHISPEYLVTHTLLTNQPLSGQHTYSCSFKKTPSSTLPPILNAIETLAILQHNSTPTRDQDGMYVCMCTSSLFFYISQQIPYVFAQKNNQITIRVWAAGHTLVKFYSKKSKPHNWNDINHIIYNWPTSMVSPTKKKKKKTSMVRPTNGVKYGME